MAAVSKWQMAKIVMVSRALKQAYQIDVEKGGTLLTKLKRARAGVQQLLEILEAEIEEEASRTGKGVL